MADRIGTPSKSQIKRWAKLTMEKYRRREGLFPAEGGKVVAELFKSGRPLEALLVHEEKIGRWEALLAGAPADVGDLPAWCPGVGSPEPGREPRRGDGRGRHDAGR